MFIKLIGLVLYLFLMQTLGCVITIFVKIALSPDWLTNTVDILDKYGMYSNEYINCLSGVLYPSLIIGDIFLILPFMIKDKFSYIHKISKKSAIDIISLGLVLNFIISFTINTLPDTTVSSYSNMTSLVLNGSPILILFVSGILTPIVEELVFRFGIFKVMKNKSDNYKIFLTALAFGIAHMNIIQSTYAFLLGLVLGKLYAKDKNLTAPILFHITVNSSSVIYEFAPANFKIICLIIVLLSFLYLIYSSIYKIKSDRRNVHG